MRKPQRGECQRRWERGARYPRGLYIDGSCDHARNRFGGSAKVRNVILPREVYYRSSDRPQKSGCCDVALNVSTGSHLDKRQHAIPCYGGTVGSEGMERIGARNENREGTTIGE